MVDRESSRMTQLLVDSHTTILRGLSLLAPKSRRSRVRWILAAGLMAVVGMLAADRSAREYFTSKGRDFYRARTAVAAPSPSPVAPPAPAAATEPSATAVSWPATGPLQGSTPVVASQAAEPASPKEAAAPSAVQPTGTRSNRSPKTRGPSRPRAAAPQGGS